MLTRDSLLDVVARYREIESMAVTLSKDVGAGVDGVIASFFFSIRRRHTRSVSAFLLNRSSDLGIPAEPLFRSSRSNTASNSTKHKSPHLSGWRQIISLIT